MEQLDMQFVKDILIWVWWRPFKGLLHMLPVTTAYRLGAVLARLVSAVPLPLKKKMEQSAVIALGPGASKAELQKAAKEGMFCFLMNELEILLFPRMRARHMDAIIPAEGLEHLDAALAQGKGAVLLTAHFGANLMIMPGIGFRGYALNQISAESSVLNEVLPENRPEWIRRTRDMRREHEHALPARHIDVFGNMKEAFRSLQQGEVLCVAGDGGKSDRGETTSFLGRQARFPIGGVKLGVRAGCPILPVFVFRSPSGFNRLVVEAPVAIDARSMNTQERTDAVLKIYVRTLEEHVRKRPGHYLRFLVFREHMKRVDPIPFWAD